MKKKEIFIGIDVSKLTLDICNLDTGEHLVINNNASSIKKQFKIFLKSHKQETIMVGMENTGKYNLSIYQVLKGLGIQMYVFNPLHLNRSLGLVRGKNDKVDALRIAHYMKTYIDQITPFSVPRERIESIQALVAMRKRLIKTRTSMNVSNKELKHLTNKKLFGTVDQATNRMIKSINKEIILIEHKINELIKTDQRLNTIYGYITSVPGVGKVLAWNLIVKTNEFKTINNHRKLACYAGVVPFEHQSGTSIYRKPRVSFMADKSLKTLLNMAAIRVIQMEGELQSFYLRKVEEGKNKMLVINAIRNKILGRVCAAVNNSRNYQNNLVLS